MKSVNKLSAISAAALIAFFTACQPVAKNRDDSAELAKDLNDATLDTRDEEKDADFIVNIIASNHEEIKLAQLALNKSADAEVREIATMLVADHTKIMTELEAYATKNSISFPVEETDEAKKDISKLAEKEVTAFDKEWCGMLKDNHEKTIGRLERRLKRTEDAELKNWITSTLPGLNNHLEVLKKHEDKVK